MLRQRGKDILWEVTIHILFFSPFIINSFSHSIDESDLCVPPNRVLEVLIAIMIFPAAVIFLILMTVHYVVKKSFIAAYESMEFLTMPCFFSTVGYYISLMIMFLAIQIFIILVLKFIYNAL